MLADSNLTAQFHLFLVQTAGLSVVILFYDPGQSNS